ncbi:MAG: hemerythrin domain-containing protein [Mycobacteriales bacterium]
MPNAVELIKSDHREVESLFEKFQSTKRREVALKICEELTLHAQIEEKLLYPDVKKEVSAELEQEAEKEHQEVKDLIAKIEGLGEGDAQRLGELMTKLQQGVDHHVQEEESEMLPKVEEQFGVERLNQIGEQITRMKQQAATATGEQVVDLTKDELYEKAKEQDVPGRSTMNKDELASAVDEK